MKKRLMGLFLAFAMIMNMTSVACAQEPQEDTKETSTDERLDFGSEEGQERITVLYYRNDDTTCEYICSGKELKPTVRVYLDYESPENPGTLLVQKKDGVTDWDYSVERENNIEPGTSTVRIVANPDSEKYTGSTTSTFAIKMGTMMIHVKKVSSTKDKVNWNTVKGATEYRIYRSDTEDGEFKLVKTVASGNNSYTFSKLKKNKTYYYKMRAIRIKGEKTSYGPYSIVRTHITSKKVPNGETVPVYNGTWVYKDGLKLFYDVKGNQVTDVTSIVGKRSSYRIKVNKNTNVVTVYASDLGHGYIIPVIAFVCSTGKSTPLMTAYTPAKYRWRELIGPTWGQWSTRIRNGILFHTLPYKKANNNNSMDVDAYNKLGTTASHGCVRLQAKDSKWIYDNCKLKTKVTILRSDKPDPLGKPTITKLPSWHTWDPTDPNMKSKCKSRGCH